MLQLSALSLGLVMVFLLPRGRPGPLFCDSSGFSSVVPTEAIFLLPVAGMVIQIWLESPFAFGSAFTAKREGRVLYAWIAGSLAFCRVLHVPPHSRGVPLQI